MFFLKRDMWNDYLELNKFPLTYILNLEMCYYLKKRNLNSKQQ